MSERNQKRLAWAILIVVFGGLAIAAILSVGLQVVVEMALLMSVFGLVLFIVLWAVYRLSHS